MRDVQCQRYFGKLNLNTVRVFFLSETYWVVLVDLSEEGGASGKIENGVKLKV